MADPEVLIRIKKILETQGSEQAQAEIKKLVEAETSAAKGASVQAGETNKLQGELRNLQQTTQGLTTAMRGGEGALQGASQAARGLSELIGGSLANAIVKAGAAFASLRAGWNIGTAIDQWLGLSDKISAAIVPMEQFDNSAIKARESIRKLGAERLQALTKELNESKKALEETLSQLDKVEARQSKIREAEQAKRKAEIQAMPEDTWQQKAAKQKAMADWQQRSAVEDVSAGRNLAEQRKGEAEKRLKELEDRKKALEFAQSSLQEEADLAGKRGDINTASARRVEAGTAATALAKFLEQAGPELQKLAETIADANATIIASGIRRETANIEHRTAGRNISREEVQAFATERAEREKAEAERAEKNVEVWRGTNSKRTLDTYGIGLQQTAQNERAQAEKAEAELKALMDGNMEILKRITAEMQAFNGQLRNLPR